MKKRELNIAGYLTVEASFLVPLMVVILIIVIYWSFYIYNNCVIYQDCYIAALRGCQLMDMKDSEIRNKVEKYVNDLLDNQLFQYQKEATVSVGAITIGVSASTSIENKTVNILMQENDVYLSDRQAESKRIDPVWLIRNVY